MVMLTDHPEMTLDVYCGRKTTTTQQQQQHNPPQPYVQSTNMDGFVSIMSSALKQGRFSYPDDPKYVNQSYINAPDKRV